LLRSKLASDNASQTTKSKEFHEDLTRRSKLDAGNDIVLCMSQLNLSACVYHRILKLSRKIADLAGSEDIQSAKLIGQPYLKTNSMGRFIQIVPCCF